MKIATYNVHSCVGMDGRHDPRRIEGVISELDADVVALQEFRYPADIALETRTPVVLTALESYECALGPTLTRRKQCFGNVLLSRHPIRSLQRIDLSTKPREPRGAIAATLDIGGVDLHILATHLGLRLAERRIQVRRILEYLDSLRSEFFVILGDFNDWFPGRSVVRVLEDRLGPTSPPKSFPSPFPLLALDRIWAHPKGALREIRAHRSKRARWASDHFPIVATLDLDEHFLRRARKISP